MALSHTRFPLRLPYVCYPWLPRSVLAALPSGLPFTSADMANTNRKTDDYLLRLPFCSLLSTVYFSASLPSSFLDHP